MPHGKVVLAVIWLLAASSGMSRGVDGHWWCAAVLCDCRVVHREPHCVVLCDSRWTEKLRAFRWQQEGMRVGEGATRFPEPSSITPTLQPGAPLCIHARYVFMIVCMWKKDYMSMYMSVVGCQCQYVCVRVCVHLQHLACWVQGAELWRMSCAYTHSPWNPHRDNKDAHTHTLKSPLTLLFIAVLFE